MAQNAVTYLLPGTRNFNLITPVLNTLQWLPIYLKCIFFALKISNGLTPPYLSEIHPYAPVHSLRSATLDWIKKCKLRGDQALGWWGQNCGTNCLCTLDRHPLELIVNLHLKLVLLLAFITC